MEENRKYWSILVEGLGTKNSITGINRKSVNLYRILKIEYVILKPGTEKECLKVVSFWRLNFTGKQGVGWKFSKRTFNSWQQNKVGVSYILNCV